MKYRVIEATAATGGALLAPPVRLDNHLQRQAHQRAHIGRQHAVGARQEDDLVFATEARHDLRHARIKGAAHALDAFEQRDLLGIGQARQRIVRQIKRRRRGALDDLYPALTALARDRAGRLRSRTAELLR